MNNDRFKAMQEVAKDLLETAVKDGKEDSAINFFTFFMEEQEQVGMIPAAHLMSDDLHKDVLTMVLKKILEKHELDCYYHVSVSWVVMAKKKSDADIRPRDHPDRKSILLVHKFHKTDGNDFWMKEYENKEGTIAWVDNKLIDENKPNASKSRFDVWHEAQIDLSEEDFE